MHKNTPYFNFFLFLKPLGSSRPPCPPVVPPLHIHRHPPPHTHTHTPQVLKNPSRIFSTSWNNWSTTCLQGFRSGLESINQSLELMQLSWQMITQMPEGVNSDKQFQSRNTYRVSAMMGNPQSKVLMGKLCQMQLTQVLKPRRP